MNTNDTLIVSALLACMTLGAAAGCARGANDSEDIGAAAQPQRGLRHHNVDTGSYNLHLEPRLRFKPLSPGANADNGRALFGLSATDDNTEDKTHALFFGFSAVAQKTITPNSRTCFSCHRGAANNFGMGSTFPLSSRIAGNDALFTGLEADTAGDPDGMHNLDQFGLVRIRPNRFNPQRPESDPFRKVLTWRKTPQLINIAFAQSFLVDGRGRVLFEADRGAIFAHTQGGDDCFDDLFSLSQEADMEAFQFGLVSDPRLLALRDPNDPLHDTLAHDPFYTVPVHTLAQKRGQEVFKTSCMTCHSTPNVFNNLDNVEALGPDQALRPVNYPAFAPSTGRSFDIGVAEQNAHHLRFTSPDGNGGFETVVLPLARDDGSTAMLPVTFDVGLAATTARYDDVGRFKVPQLRDVKDNAPYFHDNSAATLDAVINYFNSDQYNQSKDGRRYPIHLSAQQRSDLRAFLEVL